MAEEEVRDEKGRFTAAYNKIDSLYTRELADQICDLMASGMTLRKVCRQDGMPNFSTVSGWAARDVDGFHERYIMARRIQASMWHDEIIDFADEVHPSRDHVDRAKLQIESRKWCCARANPEAYGEKTQVQHSGKIEGEKPSPVALMTPEEVEAIARKVADEF